MRALGLRRHDRPPGALEIVVPLAVWSLVFEVWPPATAACGRIMTADPLDVLCYAAGALVAAMAWRRSHVSGPVAEA